jgi:hypothetical protein
MSNPDLLRAATEQEIGREIIGLVPHWYEAPCGPEKYSITVGEHTAEFYNHCKLTPSLKKFWSGICARVKTLPLEYIINMPSLIDVLLESFAVDWLRMHHGATDWARLIKYLESLARRTNEHEPVALNLVIRNGLGTRDITDARLQKFFDRLASSPFSYLAVDSELRLIDYGEVEWRQIRNATRCKFYPEFLHPIHSVMGDTDVSAHLTEHGDIVILCKDGLLAARRNRKWKIYDVRTFKNSLARSLGNYHVGANLFEVVFDLSFRRQGSLLIYDPEHRIQDHLLNPESLLDTSKKGKGQTPCDVGSGQAMIEQSIQGIPIGRRVGFVRRKRRLTEMAGVDGAVVFDDDNLLAVGALIRSHPDVGNQLGARETAAKSAYLWGAHPVKVSSDGDVTVYFRSRNGEGECDAVMQFL